ncbi:MAG: hypothetical protein KME20_00845 [Kaiparowitsia implicata GSE-PSE-MK54-09C]|jgi:hypothetical protein|nr:hypothetical protein [Kaiparowitsia implicata GSE-PSE-MK54-09C]
MILGLSHIAFGSDDIGRSTARLAEFGYVLRFDEPMLENNAAKATMLARYQPSHHIRSLAAPGAMAVELLDHGALVGQQAASLVPIFRCASPPAAWQDREESALPMAHGAWPLLELALGQRPRVAYDPELKTQLLWIASSEPQGLFACAMPTEDMEGLEALLTALRFRADPVTGLWSLLTPLAALQARMIPVPYQSHPDWELRALLDAPGCPCIALMAGSGRAKPLALQGECMAFDITVNYTQCTITMIRPQHGPAIELVEKNT